MSHELNFPPKPEADRTFIVKKSAKLITLEDLGLTDPAPTLPPQDTPPTPVAQDTTADAAFTKEWNALSQRHATPLFEDRTAYEWLEVAAAGSTPSMLFDSMWYEGELCILFADTNVGKSILAVQICDSISRGEPIPGFGMDAAAQPVAYFDFELSPTQFLARYTQDKVLYPFSQQFRRMQMSMDVDYVEWGYKTFEEFLHAQLEHYISQTGCRVVVIDNLTYLRSEAEHARDAYSLMNMLNTLKRKYNLSMLVLAHTPKRDHSKPIDVNHLQGSKQIANLSDSIIAIGRSHKDNGLRYIKQIKHRMGEKMYEEDNVCLCQIVKPDNFLHFELVGHCREREHLKETGDKEHGSRMAAIRDLSAEGMTQRDIAKQLGISVATVNRCLKST